MTTTREPADGTTDKQDVPKLGQLLVRNAKSNRDRAAAQALADEGTILAHSGVRAALVRKVDGLMTVYWEGIMSRVYTLGLDEQQRAFLGLVLSMVGIGHVPLTAVEKLDERCLLILQQAILRLAGDDRIAIATRL